MGDSGFGTFVSFVGAIISIAGVPWVGVPMMMAGGFVAQKAAKREAMEKMREAMMGLRSNTRTTERAIPVIYGRQRVGGNVLWQSTDGINPFTDYAPRYTLFSIYGISEGPIDGFEEMFFNDVKVWDVRSGQLRTQYYQRFIFDYRTGTNSQAPFEHIADYHKNYDVASETFPMMAVALLEFGYDPSAYQSVPTVTWTIRGKQVPDWTDAASPGIVGWTQSGPLIAADLLTNKMYGMGISSANLNVPDVTSSHAYATAPIAPGSRETVEIVDMSAQRPKYFNQGIDVPVYGWPGEENWDPNPASSMHTFTLSDRIPIKPGSLTFVSATGSAYKDSPRSGTISQFGRILEDPAGTQVGSVNYLTGLIGWTKPAYVGVTDGYAIRSYPFTAKWYADWEFSYRTKYQSLTRSMYIVSTPETLVETGTISGNIMTLYSSNGGAGTVDLSTGEINAYFGAHEWYDNKPVEIHYRVNTRQRFSTNFALWQSTKVMDALRDLQQHYCGYLVYANGKYGIRIDKPEGSVYSFDDDNIIAGTFRISQPSIKDIPTKVVVKYLDALNAFTPAEVPFDVRSVDPGMESEHVLEMPGVTARDEASALAYTYANIANLVNAISFETNYNALGLEAGDVVDVTHPSASWVQKLFRIVSIEFARDDKLAINAIEHDPTAYVDDWLQGPMRSRNPSFFPKRSYWPPNVTSASISEYSRTLSDGTVVPSIKYQIHAVDSPGLAVDHWNVHYANITRGQNLRVGYTGPNTVGYLSPVEPGWNVVNVHAVSDFGNESARVWTGSVEVGGVPEYEWQNWRFEPTELNVPLFSPTGILCADMVVIAGSESILMGHDGEDASGYASVSKIFNSGVQWTTAVSYASPGANKTVATCQSSGGNVALFWSDVQSGVMGAIVAGSGGAVIQGATFITRSIGIGFTAFTNSLGNMYLFGFGPASSYLHWSPISCNLFAASVNSICDALDHVDFYLKWGISAFNTTSYGVLTMAGPVTYNAGSQSWAAFMWVFSANNPGNYYIVGSKLWESPCVNSYAVNAWGSRANGKQADRIVLYNGLDPYAGQSVRAPWLGQVGINSAGLNPRWFQDKADLGGADFSRSYGASKPAFSGNFMYFVYPRFKGTSHVCEIDTYKFYSVNSYVPEQTQTWL